MVCPPWQFIIDLMKYCGDLPHHPITDETINQLCKIFLNNTKIFRNLSFMHLVSIEEFQNFLYFLDNMRTTIQACGELYLSKIRDKHFIYPPGFFNDQTFRSAVSRGYYKSTDIVLRISDSTGMIEAVRLDHVMNVVKYHIYYSVRRKEWRFHEDTTTFYDSLLTILEELMKKEKINITLPTKVRVMPPLVDISIDENLVVSRVVSVVESADDGKE